MNGENWLIVGLGNPGKQYEATRHNIGFMVVMNLARRLGCVWREERRFLAWSAKAVVPQGEIHLLLPQTYMNRSGEAVRAYMAYFKLLASSLVVAVDDKALPFLELRFREEGSSGGHNGLKSIEAYLGSSTYKRLKLGIGDPTEGTLADYVLDSFSASEKPLLPAFLDRGVDALMALFTNSFQQVMTLTNTRRNKQELDSQENKHDSKG